MSALATPPFVTIEEYLRTAYRPDCEYIDGVVEERNLGEYEHSRLQAFLTRIFGNNETAWKVRVFPEYRVQVSPTRFRVPDITVVRADTPRQTILRTPPLLAIEILSPEDTLSKTRARVGDYITFGVEHTWIIDPYNRRAYRADDFGFHEPEQGSATGSLTIQGTQVEISLMAAWQELDAQ